ncbi:MAG: NADPH-dependent F420 reductase [Acaryochloridaceae cyanobacterium RU_4_10]|nr:NADPH-dependent F420 reductase [Acaryochloridaceae cyanobacterium RU_4_10]
MNIGIIGAGNMGHGLGKLWAQSGHQLMFSYSRDITKPKKIAQSIGSNARVGTPSEAVAFADVVLLSVPYGAVGDALKAAGSLKDKIVFSIVNALLPDMSGMAVGTSTSAAEEIAKLAPDADVVEALPVFAEVLNSDSRRFNDRQATVFYTGDNERSKQVVAGLLREIDVEPIDAGALKNSRYVEPAMMLLIQLAYTQKMGQVGFKLLNR